MELKLKRVALFLLAIFALLSSCASNKGSAPKEPTAFDTLQETFSKAERLITNEDDRAKLSAAVSTILRLSKLQCTKNEDWAELYESGSERVFLGSAGVYKGAFGHFVSTAFYLRTDDTHINFFLTDDDADLVIDIWRGGHKGDDWNQWGGEFDYEPNRFYEFNTKTGSVRTGDFYWE